MTLSPVNGNVAELVATARRVWLVLAAPLSAAGTGTAASAMALLVDIDVEMGFVVAA
jgi:hypothetical protein